MEDEGIVSVVSEEEALAELREEMQKSREREERRQMLWPGSNVDQMTKLASLFPTMRGVPGTAPWDQEKLIVWLNSGGPTSGSYHAAMFLLGVWNSDTDWNEEGLRKRYHKSWGGKRKLIPGKFNMFAALSCWDENHLAAFWQWIETPFHP